MFHRAEGLQFGDAAFGLTPKLTSFIKKGKKKK